MVSYQSNNVLCHFTTSLTCSNELNSSYFIAKTTHIGFHSCMFYACVSMDIHEDILLKSGTLEFTM